MRTLRTACIALVALALAAPAARAHCQIPCGIYDDEVRFTLMLENVTTIEKSINQIAELGGQDAKNFNQIVRWVENKDHHADELAEIVTYYFMAQRIKPPANREDAAAVTKYTHELALLHGMLIHAMKAKQTTDLAEVKALRDLIASFRKSYLGH